MKKRSILLYLILFGAVLQAQEIFPAEYSKIFTDRTFFVSGEEVHFSGIIGTTSSEELLSKVVYVEILDPVGNKINQKKYYLDKEVFEGKMILPESTTSGYYFIRAYTKWMRNNPPNTYDQVMIKVVNPFLIAVQQFDDSLYLPENSTTSEIPIFDAPFDSVYFTNDKIDLNLSKKDFSKSELLQISIIPAGSQHLYTNNIAESISSISDIKFKAETRGLSLSGTVLLDEKPSIDHLVYLNVIGDQETRSVFTDSLGKFRFALPQNYDFRELMISTEQKAGEIQFLFDNDFDANPFSEKVPKFELSKQEKELSLRLAKMYQINKWYYDSVAKEESHQTTYPLYKFVSHSIDFDFYIPLDSMLQYFTDIPSKVYVKKAKGKRYFKIDGEEPAFSIYSPLIMVDWIPIDDPERVLAMNPANVKKIDVVRRLFFHSNQQYAGIIHVHTRQGNLADLKLPDYYVYLDYQFPDENLKIENQLQFPGTPFFKSVFNKNTQNIQLPMPQLPGNYIILLQQLKSNGNKKSMQIPVRVVGD